MKTVHFSLVPLVLSVMVMCFFVGVNSGKECKRLSTSKLVCYYSTLDEIEGCYCTHVILPANSNVKSIEKVKERAKGVKVYVSVNEFNQGLIDLLKSTKVEGVELGLKKLDSKNDISDFISTIKTKIGSDLDIALSVPSKADLVAKYFDFKALSKHVDLFILQTAFLGASTNVTFHPSRLSGLWDMQNTDSVIDLVNGLGAPLSKLVVSAPVQAFQFTLQNKEYTAPGSPAVEMKSITRKELCKMMKGNKNWTLERDEDQAGPYIFNKDQWIAFEDPKSMDIKVKYSKVRGLAGIALKDLAQDGGSECGSSILEAAYNGLSRQARAPRGAVLHSLEREIVDTSSRPLDSVQLSPYKISRIIDTEGKIHVVRQDSRTEFQCSRQGYFVHPRSCNRFYRCVKFDQLSDDYNVFEFDCPSGLAFDERVEVCVWPGSLPHGTPCSGSSEIAPVPRERFVCPSEPGYYADPENCRWFFACLDHGKSPLSAYEFRCPFGLVFDGDKLVCEWSWLVPKCASGLGVGLDTEYYYGGVAGGNQLGVGHAVKGLQSSELILQNYDGLGALGTVRLGGVSGKFEKPIATVYSNVGAGTLGLGYQNSGGYIEGGGLGYKAVQALQQAGLLKVNNGVGYQAVGHNEQGVYYAADGQAVHGTAYDGQSGASAGNVLIDTNGIYASGANAYSANQLDASAGLHGATNAYQGSNIHLAQGNSVVNGYTGSGGAILQGSGAQGAVSSQSFTQYHDATGQTLVQTDLGTSGHVTGYIGAGGYEASKQGVQVTGYTTGIGLGSANIQGSSGYVSTKSYDTGIGNFANKDAGLGVNIQGGTRGSAGSAVSSQSFTQYHGEEESKNTDFGSGIAGNINIIGGGYSAVGSLSGIGISNNGVSEAEVVTSFPAFVSVTSSPVGKIASVPTVTAVPVPGIKTAAGFETIKGGVVANIPEFQYKVKSLEDAGLLSNFSTSFANFVVTSPATLEKEVIQQTYSQNEDHVDEKPSINFEEGLVNTVTVSTARPFVSVTTDRPDVYVSSTVKPLTVVEQKAQEGYIYEKPSVTFQETPVVYSTPKPVTIVQPAVSTVAYSAVSIPTPAVIVQQQPQIVVSSTPAVSTYSYPKQLNTKQGGYIYNKPSITFEENPQNPTIISKFTIRKPVVATQGYYYEKPAVVQEPAIVNEIPTVQLKQKTIVEDYTYQKPAVVNQYYYQQPSIQRQPVVPLYRQPELLSTYTYQPPVLKQPVSTYTYQNVSLEAAGVAYKKPDITLVQQPVQTYSYQPSRGSSYQYTNFENKQSQGGYIYSKPALAFVTPKPTITVQETKVQGGYVYEKPSVKFEETPVVYSTQTPTTIVQQENVGYSYPKPSVQFEERQVTYSTPKPVVVQPVQPAVVTSYVNIDTSKANAENTVQQANIGYSYPKPAVHFEETPVIYSTPKPVVVQPVTPAIVNSYFNIDTSKANANVHQGNVGYTYVKPAIPYEETPVTYTTPKPIVVQPVKPAVVTSYFNIDTSKANANVHQENVGYTYAKPAIPYEETPITYTTTKPIVVQPVKSAVVTSYFNIDTSKANANAHQENVGYTYARPSISYEETPVIYTTPKPIVVQPVKPAVVTSYFNIDTSKANANIHQENVGYTYAKPAIPYEETPVIYTTPKPVVVQPVKPAVVTSYFNIDTSKVNANVHQENVGYTYAKPAIPYEETPVTYTTPKPIVVQPVKPAVVTSYFNIDTSKANANVHQENVGYTYAKPAIPYEETPVTYTTPKPIVVQPVKPAVVTSYFNIDTSKANANAHQENAGYTYAQPAIPYEETPVTYSTVKPSVVSSYFNFASSKTNSESAVQQQQSVGYSYPKPSVSFDETPVTYSTPKPFAVPVQPVTPAVVTSYFNIGSGKVDTEQQHVGYSYPKVKFEETPVIYSTPKPFEVVQPEIKIQETPVVYSIPKPAVVSSYSYEAPTTSNPVIIQQKPVQPAVVSSYNYVGSTTPQPNIIVEQQQRVSYTPKPQVVVEATPKPAVVTSYFYQQPSKGYEYPKPSVQFVEEPARQPVQEVPFVKKTAYVTGQYQQNAQENYNYHQSYQNSGNVAVENYEFPEYEKVKQVVFGEKLQYQQPQVVLNYVPSTPKPTFVSTIRTIARKKIQPVTPAVVTIYDSRYASTPASYISSTVAPEVSVVSTTSRPISRYSFSSVNDQYQYNDIVKSTTAEPIRTYLPVTSTVRITSALPKITKTKVVEEYIAPEVTTLARDYLPVRIRTKIPAKEYLPVEVTTPSTEYLPVRVRTKAPAREYLPVEVTTPSNEYLPARRVISTTVAPEITTLSREYLPVRTRVKITTASPSTVKVVRPVTVIKQSDSHPLLSAKLGAQCTCVSNKLTLRRKQKVIFVEDDDDDVDDGYVVDDGSQGNVVESYNYEPQRVVDITPTPEVYVKSSTVEPQTYIKKRVRVRPEVKQIYSPVTEVSEIFYQKNTSPALVDDNSHPSDREIVKAVRTGLKLVKQAAKEGAREGTHEVLSKQFDRYGPGGVRSRVETLQGTIDCQRAGLFRHPTECNKFYACRWDCTKNRFTLHVFNCPVHLTFDNTLGACNWPSQGPACVENTLITSD